MTAPSPGADGDPGWGSPSDIALGALIPQLTIRRARSSDRPLVAVRTIWLSFVSALFLIFAVIVLLTLNSTPGSGAMGLGPACAVAVAIALGTVLFATRLRAHLPCDGLLGAYQVRFYLRAAYLNAGALAGFVLAFRAEHALPYACALVVALIGHAATAPTTKHLRQEDARLAERGCASGLCAALGLPAEPSVAHPPAGPYHQP